VTVVSVVIPTYNRRRFIAEAVDSALGQTWSDLEVIVVDDGSTDDTVALLDRRFGRKIRVVRLPTNRGQSTARNMGVAVATGEVVAFLDSDDVWLPHKLERQLPLFDDPAVQLVHGWIEPIDEAGLVLGHLTEDLQQRFERALRRGYDYAGVTEQWCMMWTSAVVIRRSLLETIGGFDPQLSDFEDWDLFWHCALHGTIATAPEPLVGYRVHPGNMSKDLRVEAPDWLAGNRKHLTLIDQHPGGPDRRRAQRNLYINMALGEHWLDNRAASRRWMWRALRLDPGLLRRPAHPVWHAPLLAAMGGQNISPRLLNALERRDRDPLDRPTGGDVPFLSH
jgi:glycosyltransferase involved in cell wall biosynthesis